MPLNNETNQFKKTTQYRYIYKQIRDNWNGLNSKCINNDQKKAHEFVDGSHFSDLVTYRGEVNY